MKTEDLTELSISIMNLLGEFVPHVETGVTLSPVEVSRIVTLLGTQQHIAILMATELGAHRASEDNRFCQNMIENIATEKLSNILIETDGKIIRPRFGSPKSISKEQPK